MLRAVEGSLALKEAVMVAEDSYFVYSAQVIALESLQPD